MRFLIAASTIAAVLLGAAAAQAEKRVFIVASDGYGVDRCLSSGGACGATVANSVCHTHERCV